MKKILVMKKIILVMKKILVIEKIFLVMKKIFLVMGKIFAYIKSGHLFVLPIDVQGGPIGPPSHFGKIFLYPPSHFGKFLLIQGDQIKTDGFETSKYQLFMLFLTLRIFFLCISDHGNFFGEKSIFFDFPDPTKCFSVRVL